MRTNIGIWTHRVGLGALLGVALAAGVAGAQTEPQLPGKKQGAVERAIDEATRRGASDATVERPANLLPPTERSLDAALRNCSVLLCTPVSRATRWVYPDSLSTFYTVRVDEVLAKKYRHDADDSPPEDLVRSLGPAQLLLPFGGGQMAVGAVTVHDPGPTLAIGQRYVVLASLEPSGLSARAEFGDNGIFRVAPDGTLRALRNSDISRDIRAQGVARLDALRQRLASR